MYDRIQIYRAECNRFNVLYFMLQYTRKNEAFREQNGKTKPKL